MRVGKEGLLVLLRIAMKMGKRRKEVAVADGTYATETAFTSGPANLESVKSSTKPPLKK